MMSTKDFAFKQIVFAFLFDGEKISFRNDNIIILDKEGKIKHQSTCYRLFALFVCGNYFITTGLMDRAKKFGFSIVFMNSNMRVISILPARAEGNVLLRKKQYDYNSNKIAAHIIYNKIENQKYLIKKKRNKNNNDLNTISILTEMQEFLKIHDIPLQKIMGIEGLSARYYFQNIFQKYSWTARRPRVKHDKINTLLDIGYTILFNLINALLEMYGFDTYIGVLHTAFFHRKSLVCDIEEPFRPIIDEAILRACNLGQIKEEDFTKEENQYVLSWKKSVPYIRIFVEALMKYKQEIFLYVQNYYRAFVREKDILMFPCFSLEKTEVYNAIDQL